jgi:DNA-binding FrmR family transcriptional regulator
MASVSEIRERLKLVFTEAQAEILAHVVGESRDDLVTRADLHDLTEVVKQIAEVHKDLAEAQRDLVESHKDLAEAQKRTERRMEEFAQTQEELFEAQKELTWAMKDTRKQLGGLAQSVGYGLEAYAMERIPRILATQMAFIEETSGPEQFVSPAGEADDVDVVVRGTLAGRPVVFLCETKTNISPQEVREFLVTVGRVRPQTGCDDVRILYFAYRASPEARAAVAEAGGYLAFPHTLLVRPAEAA